MDQQSLSPRKPSLPSLAQATAPIFQDALIKRRRTVTDLSQVFPDLRNSSPRGFKSNAPIPERSASRIMSDSEVARGLSSLPRMDMTQPLESFSDLPRFKTIPLDSACSTLVGLSDLFEKSDSPIRPQSSSTAAAGKTHLQTDVSASDATVADAIRSIFAGANVPDLSKSSTSHQVPGRNGVPKRRRSSGGVYATEPNPATSATGRADDHIDLGNPPTQKSEAAKTETVLEILKTLKDLGYVLQKEPTHSPKPQSPRSTATERPEKRFACSQCGVTVRRRSELKYVIRSFAEIY